MRTPTVGEHRVIDHTFTLEEVRAFTEASGDRGVHHVHPDHRGRLMVHGLLLGTLPTIVGGQLNFLAREMYFEFLRPVFTGETVHCDVTLTRWEPAGDRMLVAAEWECTKEDHVLVMRGRVNGIVRTGSVADSGAPTPQR